MNKIKYRTDDFGIYITTAFQFRRIQLYNTDTGNIIVINLPEPEGKEKETKQ